MTKARTKAAKIKARRGRPALAADITTREPNGRPSRRKARASELEHQIRHVAVSRRVRHLGLVDARIEGKAVSAEEQALDPRHGYLLGRMLLDKSITETQHDAGIKYAEDMARYYGLTGLAFPSARAQDLFAVRSMVGEESQSKADASRKASDKAKALQALLLGTGDIDTGRRIEHTVKAVCVEDIDHLRTLNPVMKAWLARGLNKLVQFYGMVG